MGKKSKFVKPSLEDRSLRWDQGTYIGIDGFKGRISQTRLLLRSPGGDNNGTHIEIKDFMTSALKAFPRGSTKNMVICRIWC